MTHHGLLLLNKPKEWTSHDLVAKVRRVLNQKSVGHCGTLDPVAEGLMVILLGEATKISQYILEGDKSYIATAVFGETYDTLDVTGQKLLERPKIQDTEKIKNAALDLQGEMHLPVPIYSAVKVQGQRLHEYARQGEAVAIPEKLMKFWDVQILSLSSEELKVSLSCSKGSFIRTWISVLGERLGSGAAMKELLRTTSVPFSLEQAISVPELEEKASKNEVVPLILPMTLALNHFRSYRVSGMDQQLILNGMISHALKSQLISTFKPDEDAGAKILNRDNELLALVGLEQDKGFVIKRVFRY